MTYPHDHSLARTMLSTLVRPRRAFESLRTMDESGPGGAAIAVLGMLWGLLCFLLWSSGREPHAILLPIPPRDYYLAQGLLMLPIVTAQWWVFSEIAHRLARGEGSEAATRTALGFAYAAPMLVHVGVELLVYLLVGFDELSLVARFSLPIASLWVWALSAMALEIIHRVSRRRAVLASLAGLLVSGLAGALLLR